MMSTPFCIDRKASFLYRRLLFIYNFLDQPEQNTGGENVLARSAFCLFLFFELLFGGVGRGVFHLPCYSYAPAPDKFPADVWGSIGRDSLFPGLLESREHPFVFAGSFQDSAGGLYVWLRFFGCCFCSLPNRLSKNDGRGRTSSR